MRRLGLLEDPDAASALDELCGARGLDPGVARRLVAVVRSQAGRARRHGLYDQFDELLNRARDSAP